MLWNTVFFKIVEKVGVVKHSFFKIIENVGVQLWNTMRFEFFVFETPKRRIRTYGRKLPSRKDLQSFTLLRQRPTFKIDQIHHEIKFTLVRHSDENYRDKISLEWEGHCRLPTHILSSNQIIDDAQNRGFSTWTMINSFTPFCHEIPSCFNSYCHTRRTYVNTRIFGRDLKMYVNKPAQSWRPLVPKFFKDGDLKWPFPAI